MKNRVKNYLKYIDDILADTPENASRDWDSEIEKHLHQIQFYQHERLVHLIVFALVAVCTVMCILTFLIESTLVLIPLIVMLFVLLVPYCMHYYFLENSVQRMYDQYDKMVAKKEVYFSEN